MIGAPCRAAPASAATRAAATRADVSTPARTGASFAAALRRLGGPGVMAGARSSGLEREGAVSPGDGPGPVDRALFIRSAIRGEPAPASSAAGSVHRVATALEVLRAGERSRVEIGLPAGVAVQLESLRDGVSVTLLANPGGAHSAAAQLPALVEALTSRGVKIAEARLRPLGQRSGRGGRSR